MNKKKIWISAVAAVLLCCAAVLYVGFSGGNENSYADEGTVPTSSPDQSDSDAPLEESQTVQEPAANTGTGGTLELSFTFTRGSTPASNQYAVWIEDTEGALVKTLYVTNFTANGGYTTREDSVPTWVAKAGPATMSADEIDAVSGATPQAGNVTYTWDGTDLDGNKVPDGIYTFYLEGTLYWSSRVLASGRVTLGGEDQAVIPVTSEFSSADATNRDMLTNVSASYFANTDSMEDENMNTSTISAGGPMSPEDALEYMKNTPDLVIVEVNAPEWKLDTGFTGALWIPHTEMEERYNEIPEGVPVILHCGAGVVSVPAYETLLEKRPDIPMLSYIAGRPPVAEYNAWFASQN